MRLKINYRTCLKTGQCYYMHPELFKQGDGFHPTVLVEQPDESLRAAAEDAVELCPTSSISLVQDEDDDRPNPMPNDGYLTFETLEREPG